MASYIEWKSLKESGMLNEDLKTAAHNLFISSMGGHHALNQKSWGWVLDIFGLNPLGALAKLLGFKNFIDDKYLKAHWNITTQNKAEIAKLCAKVPKAFLITPGSGKENKRGSFGTMDTADHAAASTNTRLATKSFGNGALTTSTAPIKVPAGKGHYVVYVTFDASKIYDLKVLCHDPNNDDEKGFSVVKLNYPLERIQQP